MAPTVQRNLQGFSKQPTFSFAGLDQRALLSGIQAISPTFNGFAEDELDEISP